MLLAVHTLKIHCLDSLLMCYNIVLKMSAQRFLKLISDV